MLVGLGRMKFALLSAFRKAVISVLCVVSVTAAHSEETFDLYELFKKRDDALGNWYLDCDVYPKICTDSTSAVHSNSLPDVLLAYVEFYRGLRFSGKTSEGKAYLRKFVNMADVLIEFQDIYERVDPISGTSSRVGVWRQCDEGYYSVSPKRGECHGFLVDNGNITFALASFAFLILESPDCSAIECCIRANGRNVNCELLEFVNAAEIYLERVAYTIVHFFENRCEANGDLGCRFEIWHTGTDVGTGIPYGYFSAPSVRNDLKGIPSDSPLPINFQSSVGRTVALLYLITRHHGYLEYAQRLAGYLLLQMQYVGSDDSYIWKYWPKEALITDNYEDVAHATISIEFAFLMEKHRLGVFYHTEMHRLAQTIHSRVLGESGVIRSYICPPGSGNLECKYQSIFTKDKYDYAKTCDSRAQPNDCYQAFTPGFGSYVSLGKYRAELSNTIFRILFIDTYTIPGTTETDDNLCISARDIGASGFRSIAQVLSEKQYLSPAFETLRCNY